MNRMRLTISITAGIAVVLLLFGGIGANTIPFNSVLHSLEAVLDRLY